jgi:hypothetical protein
MFVLVLTLFISTLHALPASSKQLFWTDEVEVNDILMDFLRDESPPEDSALLEQLVNGAAPLDIEFTDNFKKSRSNTTHAAFLGADYFAAAAAVSKSKAPKFHLKRTHSVEEEITKKPKNSKKV